MIIQELYRYYERKAEEGEMPAQGFEEKAIAYFVEIDKDGKFVRFRDNYQDEKRKHARIFTVPASVIRARGVLANLLWDNIEYVLGVAPGGKKTSSEDLRTKHVAFCARVSEVAEETQSRDVLAVESFLKKLPKRHMQSDPLWPEIADSTANLTFIMQGSRMPICASAAVRKFVSSLARSSTQGQTGFCLVTGECGPLARLHPALKGVRGAQSSGARLVSFNLSAFESYDREQSFVAPTSERAAFAYTTALNTLLRSGSPNKIYMGDATVVFWSESPTVLEDHFGDIFAPQAQEEAGKQRQIQAIHSLRELLQSPHKGRAVAPDRNHFYVLGLAPNAARVAVRFWYSGTVIETAQNILQYFNDLEIDGPDWGPPLSLKLLLRATAPLGEEDRVHPLLGAGMFHAILGGGPFPALLQAQVLMRLRVDHKTSDYFEHLRAALLKAATNRLIRSRKLNYREVAVSMDEANKDQAYLLGRAFAVLEKVQRDAIGQNINATIRDRYFGAASTRPGHVFPLLLAHAQHHISKAEGLGVMRDRLLQQILANVEAFPRRFNLNEQGLFMLGYYHQKQALYKKKEDEGHK